MKESLFIPMSTAQCQLQENRIDIWQFSLVHPIDKAAALLNKEERVRAERFYFPRHQRRFTIARAMLRSILARYLDTLPETLHFNYNHYGKPSIDHVKNIEFNLSHSGEMALLAVGQNFPLGIDVEIFSSRDYIGIGKQLFSATEMLDLIKQPPFLQPLAFFNIWSQKEAFIKAVGMGLAYPTQTFSVSALPTGISTINDSQKDQSWKITSFMPQLRHSAALCFHPEVTSLRKIIINPQHFLANSNETI